MSSELLNVSCFLQCLDQETGTDRAETSPGTQVPPQEAVTDRLGAAGLSWSRAAGLSSTGKPLFERQKNKPKCPLLEKVGI